MRRGTGSPSCRAVTTNTSGTVRRSNSILGWSAKRDGRAVSGHRSSVRSATEPMRVPWHPAVKPEIRHVGQASFAPNAGWFSATVRTEVAVPQVPPAHSPDRVGMGSLFRPGHSLRLRPGSWYWSRSLYRSCRGRWSSSRCSSWSPSSRTTRTWGVSEGAGRFLPVPLTRSRCRRVADQPRNPDCTSCDHPHEHRAVQAPRRRRTSVTWSGGLDSGMRFGFRHTAQEDAPRRRHRHLSRTQLGLPC
jgi:hypothetical protein